VEVPVALAVPVGVGEPVGVNVRDAVEVSVEVRDEEALPELLPLPLGDTVDVLVGV